MGSTGRTVVRGTGTTRTTATSPNPNPVIPTTPVNGGNPGVQNQVPDTNNTPVTPNALDKLVAMDDAQMAAVVNAAKGVQMPNFLNDVHDRTQEFVFQIGLNELPQVLDSTQFAQFLTDNGLSQRNIMSRSVNSTTYTNNDGTRVSLSGDQVNEIIRSSRLNYIGGKHGGNAYGSGTYFAANGGNNTGYGGTTMNAVLNPKTARIVNDSALSSMVSMWANSHPKTAAAIGRFTNATQSIYALCMGYNVIVSGQTNPRRIGGGDYVNVIDRSAMVIRK